MPVTTSGTLASDEFWGGTINVSGNVTVPSPYTLTILPGTVIKFNGLYKITVNQGGHIQAMGNVGAPIVFTSASGNLTNKWDHLRLCGGGSAFQYCTFQYANYAVFLQGNSETNTFTNCIFQNNAMYGCYAYGGVGKFTSCEFRNNNSYGIYCYNADVVFKGNRFKNNTRGICSRTGSDLELFGNVIENNSGYGIMSYHGDNTKLGNLLSGLPWYGRNTVWNNGSSEVYAYLSNPTIQLIANYVEGSGGSDLEVINHSNNTQPVYCVYGWWGGDVLESSGLVQNINQSTGNCWFKGQLLTEDPTLKSSVPIQLADLFIDPYLSPEERIQEAKRIIAEKPNKKEAIEALGNLYSILRSDFRDNKLGERDTFGDYLGYLCKKHDSKALGIIALKYQILWRLLEGGDMEMIELSKKALKKVDKDDANLMIGDLAYAYLRIGWIEDAQNCLEMLKKEIDQEQTFLYQLEIDLQDTKERIKQGLFSPEVEKPGIKSDFVLQDTEPISNYPNPGNPTTVIRYVVETPGRVSVRIFNLLGQEVKVLVNSEKEAGIHQAVWDGRDANGLTTPSGLYLIRFETINHVFTHKITLLK